MLVRLRAQGGRLLLRLSCGLAAEEETAHPKSSVKVDQDLFHGKVLGNVAVKAVSAAGICSVRWSVDQNGEGRAIKLGPRCAFSQNYELPFYRLSVEVTTRRLGGRTPPWSMTQGPDGRRRWGMPEMSSIISKHKNKNYMKFACHAFLIYGMIPA